MLVLAWFSYNCPDRPSCLKQCSDNIEMIIWKAAQTITYDWPDDWDDQISLDRVEFNPNSQGDRVNFEAIIWKCSQTTRVIIIIKIIILWLIPRLIVRLLHGDMLIHALRSKAIQEILTFIPVIENKFGLELVLKSKTWYKDVRTAYGHYLKLEKVCEIKFSTWYYCMSSFNFSGFLTLQNQEKKQIARHKVCSPNKNHVWLVCETCAKMLLSHLETLLTNPRLLPLRWSRRSYGNY